LIPGWTFHHLGIACLDLRRETDVYRGLGYSPESADFTDPIQQVHGRFLVGGGPRLELLVAINGASVLDPWLQKGIRVYHQAYEVQDLSAAILALREDGAIIVREPAPAVAFADRRISFAMLPNLALVELIEARPSG
jgi:catechol 2,3-dioxygenase-like lactoylglutathione lyase family enzyme